MEWDHRTPKLPREIDCGKSECVGGKAGSTDGHLSERHNPGFFERVKSQLADGSADRQNYPVTLELTYRVAIVFEAGLFRLLESTPGVVVETGVEIGSGSCLTHLDFKGDNRERAKVLDQ
jgi:hypothetical protein